MIENDLIPKVMGQMPFGADWKRTEPSTLKRSKIAVMGVFPTHLKSKMVRWVDSKGNAQNLATECESTSFESGSKSGSDIDKHYLSLFSNLTFPGGGVVSWTRDLTCFFDMYPYYLASPAMHRNMQLYASEKGQLVDVPIKPAPQGVVNLATSLKGNAERVKRILTAVRPNLLLTLAWEGVSFARGIPYSDASRGDYLYKDQELLPVCGYKLPVVHLAHPNIVSRKKDWLDKHVEWCWGKGRKVIMSALCQ